MRAPVLGDRAAPHLCLAKQREAHIGAHQQLIGLGRGEVDACLIIGADPGAHLPRRCNEHLATIPTIVIDPFVSLSTSFADLHIPVACVGIDCEGTGYRMDSIPIRLRKILDLGLPTDEEVLSQILRLVREGAWSRATGRTELWSPVKVGGIPRAS